MSVTAIVAFIIANVPQGLAALDAVVAAIQQYIAEVERRAFLLGCTAMCQALILANPGLSPDDQQRWCADAIYVYARNMGQPISNKDLIALGVSLTLG